MKNQAILLLAILPMLHAVSQAVPDVIWTEGYHVIGEGDVFDGEIWMYGDVLDILDGASVNILEQAGQACVVNIFGGEVDYLHIVAEDDSVTNIYGGTINGVWALQTPVNIYAYDVTYHPTGGGDEGFSSWIEGYYNSDDSYFTIPFDMDAYDRVNIVPEPATFLLLGFSALALLKKRKAV